VWPSASPPPAAPALTWNLHDIAELPGVRAQLRRHARASVPDPDLLDQLVLALDEMASNALRHGGGEVRATVRRTDDAYLIEVSDQAAAAPPTPAVDRARLVRRGGPQVRLGAPPPRLSRPAFNLPRGPAGS